MKISISTKVICFVSLVLFCFSHCKQKEAVTEKSSFQKETSDESLSIKLKGKELISYAIATRYPHDTLPTYFKRSGFIHPLKTLGGVVLTDDFPHDHAHQHGVFTAWRSTTFKGKQVDFWNQAAEEGTVVHKRVKDTGAENSFSTDLEYIAIAEGDSIIALHEQWDMEVSDRTDYYIIDWVITQSGNGSDSLHLNKYLYGGTAFRGNAEWNVKNNFDSICYFTTNESLNHIDANHTRPLWASMYGSVGGKMGGIGIIQSKENIRYPQFIRVHPSMPYYCFTPTVEEPYGIGPNDVTKTKFRLVVFDGAINPEVMNKEMSEFNRS